MQKELIHTIHRSITPKFVTPTALSWYSYYYYLYTMEQSALPRVGNSVPAWNVSFWLLWRVRCDSCDGIVGIVLKYTWPQRYRHTNHNDTFHAGHVSILLTVYMTCIFAHQCLHDNVPNFRNCYIYNSDSHVQNTRPSSDLHVAHGRDLISGAGLGSNT